MEKVYGCGELDYTSDPICLRDFFNDASLQHSFVGAPNTADTSLSKNERDNIYRESMIEMMDSNLTDTEFSDLESICSANNFRVPGSHQALFNCDRHVTSFERVNIPPDSDLVTHQNIQNRARIHERYLKYTGVVLLDKSRAGPSTDNDLIPGSDLVATIRMYAPFQHELGKRSHKTAGGCQEIAILGSQTLADLRDKFVCSSDTIICQDLSSNPFRKSVNQAKDKYKSGMFFIGDKFYDDMRSPSNIEYSDTVLNWAKEHHLSLGSKAKMEHSKIINLTVKLGYPYLYQHQGNCEHIFCFSDVRLLHESDQLKLSKYPLLRGISRHKSRYCMLCGHYVAKWVTIGNSRVPHNPCYFCQACFLSYNYVNKKKIGDFAAYPFLDSVPEFVLELK